MIMTCMVVAALAHIAIMMCMQNGYRVEAGLHDFVFCEVYYF